MRAERATRRSRCTRALTQSLFHCVDAYFLLPGDPRTPFLYVVQRLRDGRSFASRHVTAQQRGEVVFEMTCSFQTPESGFQHAAPMPADAPPPDSLPTQAERWSRYGGDPRVPPRLRRALAQRAAVPFPLDLRLVNPVDKVAPEPRAARQLAWMRAPERLPDDPALHRCVAAYGSDFALLETALLPHAAALPGPHVSHMASLDHSMWFHRPFRADEWLLFEMESPAACGGRGLAFGRLFDINGQLVASVAQEGLIRRTAGDAAAHEAGRSTLTALRAKL